ncbi:hypothetical protein A0K93_00565 [Corynebacterium sp. BCW_4722]|nr:hypothetical protein A0K93_00565 [Corynebacterium sp. BCW_4722]
MVTYKDGSTDEAQVPFALDRNNNGTADKDEQPVKTTVEGDQDNLKTIDPNLNEDQETGIKVTGRDGDTEVTAVDEDGNELWVDIDGDGNVVVNPKKDKNGNDLGQPGVDGPIKVTVKDPDLDGGEVEFVVPVKDHTASEDDNNSGTPVEPSPVSPDDPGEPQTADGVDRASEFEPVYPNAYVRRGESGTSVQPNFTRTMHGRDFARQPFSAPGELEFSTTTGGATVDQETGRVTFTPPASAEVGDKFEVPVTVKYEDGTQDTANVVFEVIDGQYADNYDPKYEVGVNAAPRTTAQVRQTGDSDLPEGTVFTLDRENSNLNGWTVRVDAETGLIRATAPESRENRAEVKVRVSFADGSEKTITAFVDPQEDTSVAANTQVPAPRIEVPVGVIVDSSIASSLPEGTTFAVGEFDNPNWQVEIDEAAGELTVLTSKDVTPGDTATIPVVLTFRDGSQKTVNVTVVATKPQNAEYRTAYPAGTVKAGGNRTFQLSNRATHATYVLAATVEGLKAEVNPRTGELRVFTGPNTAPGKYTIPVVATFNDGSTTRIEAQVEVTPAEGEAGKGSTQSSSSNGSSTGSIVAIVLGLLATLGGAAWAVYINQDAVRDALRGFGIRI